MVTKIRKHGLRIVLFLFLAAAFSCEEQGWIADCGDCTSNEPASDYLLIKFSENNPAATINVYEGELEDGVLLNSANPPSDIYQINVRLNKKYTVTARYEKNGKTYTAVDSAIPRTKFTETQCEDACWFVYDNEIDLRLKYTAD
ncbi:MAG: hypothetical protein RBS38_05560 [Bacteroidales bacterium]|jgi:hypothetical protein|nr:hypothetical protein [Bacteroidales bacterium]